MTKQDAEDLTALIMQVAKDAAFHSSDIYQSSRELEDKLYELFGEAE